MFQVPTNTGCTHLSMKAVYRVGLVVWQLGWVDLDLECSTILLGQ